MKRRSLLKSTTGLLISAGLAGCSTADNVVGDTPTPTETPSPTPEPDPSISWSEKWLSGTTYSLSVQTQLDGAEKVLINKGTTFGNTLATITSNGEHEIAGPETKHGPIELGRMLYAVRPTESSLEGLDTTAPVGNFTVGSQKQPQFPLHLNGLHGSTDPDLSNSGTIEREYQQSLEGRTTKLEISIPKVLNRYYSNRYRVRDYGAYVSDAYDNRYIKSIVKTFEDHGSRNDLSEVEIINHMTAFVQNLEYSKDKVSAGYNEYPKYPTETLVDRGGDCEDTCILLAALLKEFGYGSVLLAYPSKQHMALGIMGDDSIPGTYVTKDGQRFYYVETTAAGWKVGQAPDGFDSATPDILPIRNHPVLAFSYAIEAPPEGGVRIDGKMQNVGDGGAENAQLKVEFQNRNKNVVAAGSSQPKSIRPEESKSVDFSLTPPDDDELRAKVSVLLNGDLHDYVTSGWKVPVEEPS